MNHGELEAERECQQRVPVVAVGNVCTLARKAGTKQATQAGWLGRTGATVRFIFILPIAHHPVRGKCHLAEQELELTGSSTVPSDADLPFGAIALSP